LLNLKWGLIAGLTAFLVSITLGFVNGVHFSNLILRALLFLVIFCVFGMGIKVLADHLAPELFQNGRNDGLEDTLSETHASSRVNITVDDSSGYAIPGMNVNSRNPEEVGNIEDLVMGIFKPPSRALDQNEEYGYNDKEGGLHNSSIRDSFGFQDAASLAENRAGNRPASAAPYFSSNLGDDPVGLGGGLLDFDAMASIFSSGSKGDSGQGQSQTYEAGESLRKPQSKKPEQLKGDFSPQELAKGISTVLSKEK
jgi:hypothetical protein